MRPRTNEVVWLCENARRLEEYSGKWVMFSTDQGVLKSGENLTEVFNASKSRKEHFVFHVPCREDLVAALPASPRKK